MSLRPLALAAVALAAPACDEPAPITVVFVTVDARPGVSSVEAIEVQANNGDGTIMQTFALDGHEFPVTFTVTPTDRTGDVRIEVIAMDGAGAVRGEGAATGTIVPDGRTEVDVLLDPADFPINEGIAGTQRLIFEYEAAGRQLASADDGFFVSFVNDCAMLGRCDVIARRFDTAGAPLVNETTMDGGDFIANLTDEFTAAPAVAIGKTSVLMVWETPDAIKAVALSREGGHLQLVDTVVSTTDLLVNDPAVAALAGGDFVVAWAETQADASISIRGRFLDAMGVPRPNPTTSNDFDFAISSPEPGEAARVHLAAAASSHGFVAVWKHSAGLFAPSDVRARFFTGSGEAAAVGNANVTNLTDGTVYGPHVVYLGGELALVAYAVQTTDDARLADGAIVLSRFSSPAGNRFGADVIVPAELPDFDVSVPAIAQRGDCAIAVVWHQCGSGGDGQGCGVLLQMLRATGSPVGEPTLVNTTRACDQETPSVGALADSFVVAWTDGSMRAPDTDGLGIRGRLIYADAHVDDGRRGAACGGPSEADCAAGLACVPGIDGAPQCHSACNPSDLIPCPRGGLCSSFGAEFACVF